MLAPAHPGALKMVAGRLARLIRPPEALRVSDWLAQNVVLIDGPQAGQKWNPPGAPYLVEIADCLGEDHPCNLVTVRKAQQTGASVLALGWMLYIADREPANTLYAVPSTKALSDVAGQKLGPLIAAWQKEVKRTVIEPQTARSGAGSTTYEKKFPGGYVSLANANSVGDLSSKTCKKGVKDEFSKWEDIPGYGDPDTFFMGRFTAFRRTKDWKILEISTPEVDTGSETGDTAGHCRIDKSFLRSDRRFWHIACVECGSVFFQTIENLIVDTVSPHKTRYRCPHCEHDISEAERVAAVEAGFWRATMPGALRHPGFHIDAFISLMMSYEAIAEDKIKADKGTEKDKKDFSTLVLGRAYKFRGDAPDYKRLMERREELKRYHVPARGLLLVASADVQMRGIWFEIVAVAPNRETWTVDAGYLDGDTSHPDNPVFLALKRRTLDATFPDAFGRSRRIDALAVDSGYRAHVVYTWVRGNQRLHPLHGRDMVLAIKGEEGWHRPPIGTPTPVDIDLDGKKTKQGCKLWPVGTWSLKSTFYSDLHKLGIRSGAAEIDPDGYCHFGLWLDEAYFKQITNEHLADIKVRGVTVGRKWEKSSDNHLLDCRVYNLALAEYLGLSTMTEDDWRELARIRGLPDDVTAEDLFTVAPRPLPVATFGEAPAVDAEPENLPPEAEPEPASVADPFAEYAALNAY